MQYTVNEVPESRMIQTGGRATYTLHFVILGTPEAGDDEENLDTGALAALTAVLSSTVTVDGKTLSKVGRKINPVSVWDVDALGAPGGTMIWEGEAEYALFSRTFKSIGESSYSFDTGGGNQHITQSISTTNSYPAGAEGGGAINSDGATRVEGVDIVVPVYNFSETHYLANATVDAVDPTNYKQGLFNLTGKVNAAAFKGFAAGEVLFLGASGSQRGTEDWEITFKFAASPNTTGRTVGSITGIDKKGWEYMWVQYQPSAGTGRLLSVPVAVHVEKVYEDGDFSTLGIS